MAKEKKNKVVQMLSPENYIKQKARTLPIHQCTVNAEWEETGLAQVTVIRKHVNENFTAGFYLVDLKCLGVKDAHYVFNISQHEFNEVYARSEIQVQTENIPYTLAHNIIYAGLEFAEDYGFKPHKTFTSVAKYILEEDTEDIELLEIPCGNNEDGAPIYMRGPNDDEAFANRVMAQLEKTAGPGNYHYVSSLDEDWQDEEFEEKDDLDMRISEEFDDFMESMKEKIDQEYDFKHLSQQTLKNSKTLQFKIQLKGVDKPAVWRRVSVPSYYTFWHFHEILQVAFDWDSFHMYHFSEKVYGSSPVITSSDPETDFFEEDQLEASEVMLSDIFKKEGKSYTYLYDFGDNWEHRILLEKISPYNGESPKLLAGKGKCPPEDSGGAPGYAYLKEILNDPNHPEYEEYRDWLELDEDETWDPEEFDLAYWQVIFDKIFGNSLDI